MDCVIKHEIQIELDNFFKNTKSVKQMKKNLNFCLSKENFKIVQSQGTV